MADVKKYLDLVGLGQYNTKIKDYIDTADAKSIKTVILNGDTIEFYKKENPTEVDTPDYSVAISSTDVTNLKTRVGLSTELNTYETKTDITNILNVLTGDATTEGSIQKIAADTLASAESYTDGKIETLDSEVSVTAGTDGLAIKITEVDGKLTAVEASIAEGTYDAAGAAKAVQGETTATVKSVEDAVTTLNADGATVGSVANSIKATAKDATYSEGVTIAQAIKNAEDAATAAGKVDVVKQETAEEGYAATYYVTQNDKQVGAKINIPKDYLVKSASVKTVTEADVPVEGYKVGDKYIDFVVNSADDAGNESHIYLLVNELVDVYTGATVTNGITVKIDEHNVVSAEVSGKAIARENITADFEGDLAALEATHATDETGSFKTVATEVAEGIAALDATVVQDGVADGGNGLTITVVETDGALSSVSGSINTITEADINALF